MSTFWAKAEYRELFVERGDAIDSQPLRYSKAGAIDNGKILSAPGKPNIPGNFQIGWPNSLDYGYAASQPFPKSLSDARPESVVK